MNRTMRPELKLKAITANVQALHALLADAEKLTSEADAMIAAEYLTEAMGLILSLDNILEDVRALHAATVTLHRLRV